MMPLASGAGTDDLRRGCSMGPVSGTGVSQPATSRSQYCSNTGLGNAMGGLSAGHGLTSSIDLAAAKWHEAAALRH